MSAISASSLLAAGFRWPASLLDSFTPHVTAAIAALRREFGHRAMAADGHDVVTQAMAERATASRPASALYREPARFPSEGIDDHYGRFQREIIPHLDAAYNFARFLSRDPDAAHDIVQETFLRAFRGFAGYQGGDPRAWIFSIVRNCYRNWLLEVRHKARLEADIHRHDDAKEFSIDDVAANEDTPEEALVRKSEAGVVRHVLGKLPRALREVLVLRELEGLSYRQIAESSALPIGTVMSRLARARTQFQNLWQQEKQT